ncbi:MAG: hypothetical protein F6J93_24275 [Oscillatoria sp. SIO1A7]|nr:hypothetical protein [Oscillatoria sp. SIO1A7]
MGLWHEKRSLFGLRALLAGNRKSDRVKSQKSQVTSHKSRVNRTYAICVGAIRLLAPT